MSNIFELYPELAIGGRLDNDPMYNAENLYKRFSAYMSPIEIKDKTILDIGSQYGQTGFYALHSGAKEYVGLEIRDSYVLESKELLHKYFSNHSWEILHTSLEKFIETNTKKFDVIFLGRVIHAITEHGIGILSKLAEIADVIVIESVTPLNFSHYKLTELLKTENMLEQIDFKKIETVNHFVEYEHPFIEYIQSSSGDFVNTLYSLGFLKLYFQRIGFEIELSSYERLKKEFPEEYGIGYLGSKHHSMAKKFIVRFNKTGSKRPLSRAVYESEKGISSVEV